MFSKWVYRCVSNCALRISAYLLLVSLLCSNLSPATSQPLLNSLIPVLFRDRPSWPSSSSSNSKQPSSATVQFFPNSIRQISPLVSSGSSHQGILIAHPIVTSNNYAHQPQPMQFRIQTPTHPPQQHQQHHSPFEQVTGTPFGFYRHPSPAVKPPQNNNNDVEPLAFGDEPHYQHQSVEHYHVLDENTVTDSSVIQQQVFAPAQDNNMAAPPLDFRPSPQILGPEPYELQSENTLYYNNKGPQFGHSTSNEVRSEGWFQPNLRYESGFQPSNAQHRLRLHSEVQNEFHHPWTNLSHVTPSSSPTKKPSQATKTKAKTKTPAALRQDRQIVTAEISKSVVTSEMSVESSSEGPVRKPVYRKPKHSNSQQNNTSLVTAVSSSDRVEDWIKVENTIVWKSPSSRNKFPMQQKKRVHFTRPVKCEFHRYGFCGVDTHYPKKDVEKIASRCYTLLTHIIAPQMKHNLATSVNGTIRERYSPGKRYNQRGWSWKTYQGSPICNYLELTVTPGWAKDELGDWVVILQTREWKQEAQISICTSSKAECVGPSCSKKTTTELLKTRCVQRFAAQRLAVLDPENQDRCPIIKSVFLPSACICISAAANGSTDQLETSSSEISHISHVMRPDSNDTTFMIVTEKFTVNENRK